MATYSLPILDRQGRECDAAEIIRQVGKWNLLAISGGKWGVLYEFVDNVTFYPIGAWLPCGAARMVEITLDFDDTYRVRRVRRITRGAQKNGGIIEFEQTGVYCDEVGEVAYRASCWR